MAELIDLPRADLAAVLPSSGKILCCLCGISIIPNAAAMCLQCLQTQVDITEGIPTEGEIVFCKKCDRWQVASDHWVAHELESMGLLNVCMKKIAAFSDHSMKIISASWIWTEHHSKRLKFVVEIEKGVMDDKLTVRQKVFVDFVVKNKQCLDCIHEATDHTWGALLQLRQGGGTRKTFSHLEAMLTKANLFHLMSDVIVTKDGLDLYFKHRNQADKVLTFISSVLPTRITRSKKLISQDLNSNTARHEHTVLVEIVPLNRGDLIVTSKALTGKRALYLVHKISSLIHCVSPQTMECIEISASKYFALSGASTTPVVVLATEKQLRPFVVLDINLANHKQAADTTRTKVGLLAEAQVAREDDMEEVTIMTHLGHLLSPGDMALGYDLQRCALGLQQDAAVSGLRRELPDIVLVRKHWDESTGGAEKGKRKGGKKRIPPWIAQRQAEEGVRTQTDATRGDATQVDERREGEEAERRKKSEKQEGEGEEEEEGSDWEDVLYHSGDEEGDLPSDYEDIHNEDDEDEGAMFADEDMEEVV